MSRFDGLSPISEVNRCAAEEAVVVPPALWNILTECRGHWERTRGGFDITQGPLEKLWREHLNREVEPSEEAIREVQLRTGMGGIYFDEGARALRFGAAGMALDLGGFGKGFALERLTEHFREQGVTCAFLSFGESSVTVMGSHPHGPAWPVGVADMFRPNVAVHTFSLRDYSLSTSGTAPFNAMGGAHSFGHIISPREGRPISGYRTMSVASASAIEAEVLSTALLAVPETERVEILLNYPGVSALEIIFDPRDNFASRIHWRHEI